MDTPILRLDIWSDIACPWCYVGKRRLESALSRFGHRDRVQIRWRAFELDPSAPAERSPDRSYAERLARKYRTSVAEGEAMIARMTETAAADGIGMRFDIIRPGNTFDAHRLLHFSRQYGLEGTLKERLLGAYLCEGLPIGSRDALTGIAGEIGLDESEVRGIWSSTAFAAEVRADEARATELGIQGVPFFVFSHRFAVSGAQPAEVLLAALEKSWVAAGGSTLEAADSGASCGPDGCG